MGGFNLPDYTNLNLIKIGGDNDCVIINKASAGNDAEIALMYNGTDRNKMVYLVNFV